MDYGSSTIRFSKCFQSITGIGASVFYSLSQAAAEVKADTIAAFTHGGYIAIYIYIMVTPIGHQYACAVLSICLY